MILEIVVDNNYNVGTQNRREMKTTINNIDKILKNIKDNKNKLDRDELHRIAKYCDDIIVERFIKKV